ncbi:MAG: NAD-dependent epimerase/dehydratase family protein [Arenicellales bacterium]
MTAPLENHDWTGNMNADRKIAVTGATGFLGQHLCERLLKDGYQVSILARDPEKAKVFAGRVAKTVIGDITDKGAIAELVEGADLVVHLVSNFRTASGPPESYISTNLKGTETVLEAADNAGIKRLVHCSTIGVHGNVKSTPASEDSPYNPGDLYQETKRDAELACHREMEKGKMEIVIVRPCSMYGPGDLRMLKMFRMLAKNRFFLVGPCRENFHAVYIDDIVEGFIRAITVPNIGGETFIIGGPGYLQLDDYIKTAANAVGASPPKLRFPYSLFISAAWCFEMVCVPLRIEPPLHRRRVRFFKNNRAFNIDKARKILAYEPTVDLEEGMRRTVDWYRDNGYL